MSQKIVNAVNTENYVVQTEVETFEYTMDHADRNPNPENAGTSPTGLLTAALAGCYLMTCRSFLEARKIDFNQLSVNIVADFEHQLFNWAMLSEATLKTDADLDEKSMTSLKRFIDNYCTVSNVLKKEGNQLELRIELV